MSQFDLTTLINQQTQRLLPQLGVKIAALQQLNHLWQKYVDIKLAQHSRVANWRDGHLVIEIDNAGWAVHVRYALTDLLRKLKGEPALAGLKRIDWYIQPAAALLSQPRRSTPAALSPDTQRLLCAAATHIAHEKLKAALLTLAARSEAAQRKS